MTKFYQEQDRTIHTITLILRKGKEKIDLSLYLILLAKEYTKPYRISDINIKIFNKGSFNLQHDY